jgi:ubiquinone biosynthesis protein
VLQWPGNILHVVWLVVVSLMCGLMYGVVRLAIALTIWGPRRATALATVRGFMLRQAMTALGATFIKLGQVMSTRPDLFAPQITGQLRRLQDRLPPFSYRRARATIEADLGRPVADMFTELDEAPVAAASVAQVHRARLHDGREVAIKVLRPGVRRQVERDQVLLLALARLLALLPSARGNDPVGHIRQLVDAIHAQTDLRIEAANYRRFHANFAGRPDVMFPAVIAELSSERVLTMQFVRGAKVDALPATMTAARKARLAETLRRTMLQMCFEDGFVHADLHPGNLLVRDDDTVVVLDVGLAKVLREDVLIQFIDMSKCLAMGTADDLVAHLQRFHSYLGPVDWDALRVEVGAFAAKFRARDAGELEYGELIGEMLAIGRKYRVRPLIDLTMVFVAMITAQGIGKMLEPEHSVFTALAQFLIPILTRRNERVPDTAEARTAQHHA